MSTITEWLKNTNEFYKVHGQKFFGLSDKDFEKWFKKHNNKENQQKLKQLIKKQCQKTSSIRYK